MRWPDSRVRCRAALAAMALSAFAAASAPTAAQVIYRCVQKGKPVSLQSEPCNGRAKTTAIRGYVPEPTPTANELAWKRYRTEQDMAARNNTARKSSVTSVAVTSDKPSCAQVKADRDAQRGLAAQHRGPAFLAGPGV